MADAQDIEKAQKKVLLEDRLERSEARHASKIALGSFAGAVVGFAANTGHYLAVVMREFYALADKTAAKLGTTRQRLLENSRIRDELLHEYTHMLEKNPIVGQTRARVLPALAGGAVLGGVLASYRAASRNQKLKKDIADLGASAGTDKAGTQWQERIASDGVAQEISR